MVQIKYYSGYIRNYKKLCEELGITLPLSREDREQQILAKGFEKWGTAIVDHLYGAFAFALSDGDKVYCFRDHVGQKQMFYTTAGGEFLCSGDIDEIASDSRVEKKLNRRMLQQYLFYGYPIGSETFYEARQLRSHATGSPYLSPMRARQPTSSRRRYARSSTRFSVRNAPTSSFPTRSHSSRAALIRPIFSPQATLRRQIPSATRRAALTSRSLRAIPPRFSARTSTSE